MMLPTLFGSRLRSRLLSWLALHPDEEFYVRQLASLVGEDPTNVSRELARLAKLGLVAVTSRGRQRHYRIDRDCAVYPEIRGLALKTAGLADVLRGALGPLASRIRAALLFGSLAAGSETPRSDVDVLIVGDVSFAEVVDALGPAEAQLGREVNPVVYSPREFRQKVRRPQPFLTRVLEGKKLFLIGSEHELAGLAA